MGFFKSKKKRNEYDEANQSLNETELASDRVITEMLADDDQRAGQLINQLKAGCPLILNFEELEPMAANKLLAFFAGACYAIEGRNIKINEKIYLFARKVDFYDGSLKELMDSIPRE